MKGKIMNDIEAIKERHSVRNYESREIEAEKKENIKSIIEEVNK